MKTFWEIFNIFCIFWGILGLFLFIIGEISVSRLIWMLCIGGIGLMFLMTAECGEIKEN
jgi:hypothetical protein